MGILMTPNQRRGYLIAREFVLAQFFAWFALLVGSIAYFSQDSYRRELAVFPLASLIALLVTYLPFLYIRAFISAWRIWRGSEPPPEVTLEEQKSQVEAAQAAVKGIMGGG
nr:hypothetical protein [uncultured Roseateles sp.]